MDWSDRLIDWSNNLIGLLADSVTVVNLTGMKVDFPWSFTMDVKSKDFYVVTDKVKFQISLWEL